MSFLRTEHPNPQFERSDWCNLNGEWQFEIDNSRSGREKGFYNIGYKLSGIINVPFCPESSLSGVNNTDFMLGVWYKRTVRIPIEKLSDKIILHFGAVDYKCSVMVEAVLQGAGKFTATVLYKGKNVGAASAKSGGGRLMLDIRLWEKHLWEPGKGRLYDVILNYGEDSVKSYFGLRSIRLDDRKFLILVKK